MPRGLFDRKPERRTRVRIQLQPKVIHIAARRRKDMVGGQRGDNVSATHFRHSNDVQGLIVAGLWLSLREPPANWDFVIGQRFGPDAWGDFVHRLSRGEIERPKEVRHWREVKVLLDAQFIEADARVIREAWRAFEASVEATKRASGAKA